MTEFREEFAGSSTRELASLVACTMGQTQTRPDLTIWPEIRTDFRIKALRTRMQEYSITFAAEVDRAATEIEREATDVDPWLAAHPLRDLSFVRDSPIARFARQAEVVLPVHPAQPLGLGRNRDSDGDQRQLGGSASHAGGAGQP